MLEDLIVHSLKLLKSDENLKKSMPGASYFNEYRTITLGVPRQSGKTTAIKKCMGYSKYLGKTPILFVHNEHIRNNFRQAHPDFPSHQLVNFSSEHSVQSLIHNTRGLSYSDNSSDLHEIFTRPKDAPPKFESSLPIQCFMIDEYEYMSKNTWVDILNIAGRLDAQGKLSPEFYILRLGT